MLHMLISEQSGPQKTKWPCVMYMSPKWQPLRPFRPFVMRWASVYIHSDPLLCCYGPCHMFVILPQVKAEVEKHTQPYSTFKAIKSRKRTVDGSSYLIKVGDVWLLFFKGRQRAECVLNSRWIFNLCLQVQTGSQQYIHVQVFSSDGVNYLTGVQEHQTVDSPIEPF